MKENLVNLVYKKKSFLKVTASIKILLWLFRQKKYMKNKININTICQKIRILSSAMINIQVQSKKTSAIITSMQKKYFNSIFYFQMTTMI